MSWIPQDFGERVSGISGVTATGSTQADAYQIGRKVTVFTTVGAGTAAVLPSSYASGTEIRVLNRGANGLRLYPAKGDQIETYGVDAYVTVAPGGDANLCSFDQPASPSPRTWWLT